jgi:hypothetical protein
VSVSAHSNVIPGLAGVAVVLEELVALGRAEQSSIVDAMHAARQDMQQEPADELFARHLERLVGAAVAVVLHADHDSAADRMR